MYNFITLFDKNYLSRGLALYNSLLNNCDTFFLYILALDFETKNYFENNNKKNLKIIFLNDLELKYLELKSIKNERSWKEYCWTLTPYSIHYAITELKLDSCTYLDADIFFYSNPKIIFDLARDKSIIITEHRYTPEYDQTTVSGKYCVQFVYFKNDFYGLQALNWWKQKCKEWCYSTIENGKFGDQKYLDDWSTRFENVYIPIHSGCGVAPWNIQQFNILNKNNILYVEDKITKKIEILIFYHFHNIKLLQYDNNKIIFHLSEYNINESIKQKIYINYCKLIFDKNISSINPNIKLKKPSAFDVYYFIFKDKIKSLFLIKKYHYYHTKINNKYLEESNKLLTIYQSQ